MTLLHRLASVLRWVFSRDRAERGLDDELQAFVDMAAADRMRDGLPAAEARRLAILELGGVEQAKERVRTDRHGAWLDEVGPRHSLRLPHVPQGPRLHRRHRPHARARHRRQHGDLQPDRRADAALAARCRIRRSSCSSRSRPPATKSPGGASLSYADRLRARRGRGRSSRAWPGSAPSRSTSARRVPSPACLAHWSPAAYYDTLGLTPALGRLLTREDDAPGAPLVTVVSYGYWERQLGRQPRSGRPDAADQRRSRDRSSASALADSSAPTSARLPTSPWRRPRFRRSTRARHRCSVRATSGCASSPGPDRTCRFRRRRRGSTPSGHGSRTR